MTALRVPGVAEPRILFVVNNAAFFVSHRLAIAQEALDLGYKVELCVGHPGSATLERHAMEMLAHSGIRCWRVPFTATGMNPLIELMGMLQLILRMVLFRPALVHCVSPKGLYYGGIAARIARVPAIVLAVSGMGYASTPGPGSLSRRLAGWITRALATAAYGHPRKRVIVQNQDDEAQLVNAGLAKPSEVRLIPGSGVALDDYIHLPIERRDRIILLPARMLVDKGVLEFVDAARLLRHERPDWRFVLAGTADYASPSAIAPSAIESWVSDGVVEWLGHVDDMPSVLGRTSIVCLPSYREGMPKVLLEAAAAGCAVVTTDATGCREAIIAGVTGDLVPLRDVDALSKALLRLMDDERLRARYGRAGRQLAIERFGLDTVVRSTLCIYEEMAGHG